MQKEVGWLQALNLVRVRMAGAPVWLLLLLALISLIFRSSTSLFSFLGILTKQ